MPRAGSKFAVAASGQERKLASINGELDTLRMLGKHENIARDLPLLCSLKGIV